MKYKIGEVLIICTYFLACDCGEKQNYDIYWERIENVPGKDFNVIDLSKLRVIRVDKDRYLNGTVFFNADVDNSFKIAMKTSFSPRSDSQFIALPYTFMPTEFCDFYNTHYKKFAEPILKDTSNLPIVPPEGICPFPKGQYDIKNAEIISDSFPVQGKRGLLKLDVSFTNSENKYVGGFFVYLRIELKVPASNTG